MENLTQLERVFIQLLRELNTQQQQDVLRVLEALSGSQRKE
ncbi:hypothetical protein [Pseudomonas chlororaphis]|nr:hypothetical protein [Pseudomonas chlororaphis]